MKKTLLAFAAFATVATCFATSSFADTSGLRVQVQYSDDDGYRPDYRRRPDARGPDWDNDRRPGRHDRDGRSNWGSRDALGPRQITRTLERRGYAVGDIRLERDTYFVRATRPNGQRVIVLLDAYSGRVVGERRPGRR